MLWESSGVLQFSHYVFSWHAVILDTDKQLDITPPLDWLVLIKLVGGVTPLEWLAWIE